MAELTANRVQSTVATLMTTSSTTVTIQAGDVSKFNFSVGDTFSLMLWNDFLNGPWEICEATWQGSATITIVRAHEPVAGTQTPQAWAVGTKVAVVLTEGAMVRRLAGLGGGSVSPGTLDVTVGNATGSTIAAGTVVKWEDDVDANGIPTVLPSRSTDFNGYGVPFGIVTETIADGATGNCRCIGPVTGLDTSMFPGPGREAFADAGGALTTRANSPNGLWLGIVQSVDATNGSVFVGVGIGSLPYVAFHTHSGPTQGGYHDLALFSGASIPGAPASGMHLLFFEVSVGHLHTTDSVGHSFDLQGGYREVNTDVTLDSLDDTVVVDASGAARVITLPAANLYPKGKMYRIKKVDASANTVTITRSGSDTIDNATTMVLTAQYQSATPVSNGVSKYWLF